MQSEYVKNYFHLELNNIIIGTMINNDTQSLIKRIRNTYDVMFVIGIGGSYAGSKAAIDFLETDFPVEFIGNSFESNFINDKWKQYQDKKIIVCVISKSGETFEITSTFNLIEKKLKEKYGESFYNHIIAITGEEGMLRKYANDKKIQTLLHPNVGGRYSVLSIVGLFPMAVAGINVEEIMQGANDIEKNGSYIIKSFAENRFQQYKNKKTVEVFAVSSVYAKQFGNWYQQLFGESEGKKKKGIWTSVLVYSRDLHSMGQFIQQGNPTICETIINVKDSSNPTAGLNEICIQAVVQAHKKAGIAVEKIDLPRSAFGLGRLFRLFMSACVLYCEYLGVNPFDQPGVEDYKNEMRSLLKI